MSGWWRKPQWRILSLRGREDERLTCCRLSRYALAVRTSYLTGLRLENTSSSVSSSEEITPQACQGLRSEFAMATFLPLAVCVDVFSHLNNHNIIGDTCTWNSSFCLLVIHLDVVAVSESCCSVFVQVQRGVQEYTIM